MIYFIVIAGDHGYRFSEIRQTLPGWYEDKLPTFFLYLPPNLTKMYPSWKTAVELNAR